MTKRLQVLMADERLRAIQKIARRQGLSVGEWVRRVLDEACRREPQGKVAEKLAALERALLVNGPTCDIEQMNAEIARGYLEEDIA
jgi:hypothetical protein